MLTFKPSAFCLSNTDSKLGNLDDTVVVKVRAVKDSNKKQDAIETSLEFLILCSAWTAAVFLRWTITP